MFAQMQKCVRGSLARMAFEKVRFPGSGRNTHLFGCIGIIPVDMCRSCYSRPGWVEGKSAASKGSS
jgi:hypothetical protein